MRQLSATAVKSKISDLSQIQCKNLNKTVEKAMEDVNCGMIVFLFSYCLTGTHFFLALFARPVYVGSLLVYTNHL